MSPSLSCLGTSLLLTIHFFSGVLPQMCVDTAILICVNLLGIYWRFMSEVAFRRAFLDKRGSLESKFKVRNPILSFSSFVFFFYFSLLLLFLFILFSCPPPLILTIC